MFPRHIQHLMDVARTTPANGQGLIHSSATGLWTPGNLAPIPTDIVQAANETRANNTFTNANTLRLAGLTAGVPVDFAMALIFQGFASCGIKMMVIDDDGILDPGSVVEMIIGTGTTHRSASGDIASGNVTISHGTQASATARITGRLVPNTAGEVYFRWAQVTTDAGNPMALIAGSRLVTRTPSA